MSFAYLPLYTGDYRRDTAHLDCAENGIYLLFLMHCWDSQGPVPLDERKQAGICGARSGSEVEAMRRILLEFFVRLDDGWYNRRMQREVERANAISIKRKSAGAKGYQAKAKHLPSKSLASASTLTPNPILTLPLHHKDKNKAQAPFVLPDWIPAQQWDAWLESRAKARKSPTVFAKKLAVAKLQDLEEQGHSPAAVLAQSAFNGWSGLFPVKETK